MRIITLGYSLRKFIAFLVNVDLSKRLKNRKIFHIFLSFQVLFDIINNLHRKP